MVWFSHEANAVNVHVLGIIYQLAISKKETHDHLD